LFENVIFSFNKVTNGEENGENIEEVKNG